MPTDEKLRELLQDSFHTDTRSIVARPDLAATVRTELVRARRVRTGVVAGLAVAASTAVALGTQGTLHHGSGTRDAHARVTPTAVASHRRADQLKNVQLAAFRFTVPADARVTKSCLPKSRQYLTGPVPVGEQFMLVDAPHRESDQALEGRCVGATIRFTTQLGRVVGKVETAGQSTVYLIESDAGTQSGGIALDARQSANAAAAVDGPSGRYYEVFMLPSDTSRSVLVAGLRQYHPVG